VRFGIGRSVYFRDPDEMSCEVLIIEGSVIDLDPTR
jgi:hypothetical protein